MQSRIASWPLAYGEAALHTATWGSPRPAEEALPPDLGEGRQDGQPGCHIGCGPSSLSPKLKTHSKCHLPVMQPCEQHQCRPSHSWLWPLACGRLQGQCQRDRCRAQTMGLKEEKSVRCSQQRGRNRAQTAQLGFWLEHRHVLTHAHPPGWI